MNATREQNDRLAELEPLARLATDPGWLIMVEFIASLASEANDDALDCRSSDHVLRSQLLLCAQQRRDMLKAITSHVASAVMERTDILDDIKSVSNLEESNEHSASSHEYSHFDW